MKSKIIVLELDGGTWDVINPLLKEKKLPNFQKLLDLGAHGDLLSDHPMISPRIWTTIFTGKKSEKHGIEFFGDTTQAIRCKRIWDIFSDEGKKVSVVGSLVTWPPTSVNGYMIPSIFSMGSETYPDNQYSFFQDLVLRERKKLSETSKSGGSKLLNHIQSAIKCLREGITFSSVLYGVKYLVWEKLKHRYPLEKYWRQAILYHRMLSDIFFALQRKISPDFTTLHIHLCDAVSHRYWKFYEPDVYKNVDPKLIKHFGDIIPRAYMDFDKTIGECLRRIDLKTTTLAVVSDHGFGALSDSIQPHILDIEKFLSIFALQEKIIPARFGIKTYLSYTSKHRSEMEKITEKINKIVFKDSKEPIFKAELYDRYISLQTVPALWRKEVRPETSVSLGEYGQCLFGDLFPARKLKITGIHKEKGIMIFAGPHIKKGTRVKPASVLDITPTLLAIAGKPVGEDMDGQVISSIFEDNFLKSQPITSIPSHDTDKWSDQEAGEIDIEKMKDRLESLGYM